MSNTIHGPRSSRNWFTDNYLALVIVVVLVIFGVLNTAYGLITNTVINVLLALLGMGIVYWVMKVSATRKSRNNE
ncbi:hypothetical protein MB46_19900 (plasmid) [Arthrobacter alpinus]|uniref:hypothetical protein n=1 Tax=Arthrobacter alpinus TaxID=656366 RepID=UPI0005CA8B29|nr:hypothetical protein [Arthrobacter alpinus]ALV47930.1 hypothetical protein MB46_19900 [Arthrobacter alpinus]